MSLKSLFSIETADNTGELSKKIVNICGFKIKFTNTKKEFKKFASYSNNNLIQLVYLQLKNSSENDLFCLKNDCVNYIFTQECKNLDYKFFKDFILPKGYSDKLMVFEILDYSSELYKEHFLRIKNGEFLWKYADRFGYIEHKFLSKNNNQILINSYDNEQHLISREYVNGQTMTEYLQNKTYEERLKILEKMFRYFFEKYRVPNEKNKVSSLLSDFHLGNIIVDSNENFYFIDFDDRFNENIENGFCIYYSLYNYDKKLYNQIMKTFNCITNPDYYAKKYSANKVHAHIINKSNQRDYEEQKVKFFKN